jgi:two-component system phosphate regulon response regulator OmpR
MTLEQVHLLVVDDDERLRKLLARYLGENDFHVTTAASAAAAEEQMAFIQFDLIILDVMMPGESGLDFAKRLLERGCKIPILFLTAMGDTEDRIKGLELGVDEYMPKPFEPKELLLRIRAILRRAQAMPPVEKNIRYYIGSWQFDVRQGRLEKEDQSVQLTSTESMLLKILLEQAGQVVTREELLTKLEGASSLRAIDVQITRIRRKLGEDVKTPSHIQTIRNQGYILWV